MWLSDEATKPKRSPSLSAWRTVGFSYGFGLYSDGYLEMPMWQPQSLLIVGSVLVLLAAIARIGQVLRGGPADGDERS